MGTQDSTDDQFAFAASLWRALHGERPFGGATPAEVQASIRSSPAAPCDVTKKISRR